MGNCIHNSYGDTCTYYTGEPDENLGISKEGYCVVEDDEVPLDSCTHYETDEEEL